MSTGRLRTLGTPAFVVVMLVLASCSGGEGDNITTADTPAADSQTTAPDQSDSDTGAKPLDSGDLPPSLDGDFRVAIPAGWERDIHADIGLKVSGGAQLLYSANDFDEIVAFYDDWTEQQPVDYARTVAGDQIIYNALGEPITFITVTKNHEEAGDVYTHLLISAKSDE